MRKAPPIRWKHGHGHDTPVYRAWRSMKYRCQSKGCKSYKHYGGRGIKVCERWQDFENFLADMGPRPSPKHSLDRINNDGNYEPGNCRWATWKQQRQNTSKTRLITFNGETMCFMEWARKLNLTDGGLDRRLRHWPLELALTMPRLNGRLADRLKQNGEARAEKRAA